MTREFSEWADVLAEVLEARVTPRNATNPFGPVAGGGSIKLHGTVLRAKLTSGFHENSSHTIELEPSCNPDTPHLSDLSNLWVYLDEIDDDNAASIEDACLAPLEICTRDEEMILQGLVLEKTANHSSPCKTQFRRVGVFNIVDGSYASDDDSGSSCYDDRSDSSGGNGIDARFQGGMDKNSEDVPLEGHGTSSKKYCQSRWKRYYQHLKEKGLFRDIDSWFAERVREGPEERTNYLQKDPYVNGPPINTDLQQRYPPKLEAELIPSISQVLKAIARVAQNNKANGTPDPVLGWAKGTGITHMRLCED